jgi:hypothetical protein
VGAERLRLELVASERPQLGTPNLPEASLKRNIRAGFWGVKKNVKRQIIRSCLIYQAKTSSMTRRSRQGIEQLQPKDSGAGSNDLRHSFELG